MAISAGSEVAFYFPPSVIINFQAMLLSFFIYSLILFHCHLFYLTLAPYSSILLSFSVYLYIYIYFLFCPFFALLSSFSRLCIYFLFTYFYSILGAFAKFRKATIILSSLCLSVRQNERMIMKFRICEFFEILSRKFKFRYNLTRITGTLHEDQYTFLIISRSVLLRTRNVWDKSCRENQNTHFVFSKIFPKIGHL